jgi:hypothetical protein
VAKNKKVEGVEGDRGEGRVRTRESGEGRERTGERRGEGIKKKCRKTSFAFF